MKFSRDRNKPKPYEPIVMTIETEEEYLAIMEALLDSLEGYNVLNTPHRVLHEVTKGLREEYIK